MQTQYEEDVEGTRGIRSSRTGQVHQPWPAHPRKDSVVSFSPSANSLTPIIETQPTRKGRSISQSSEAYSDDSTGSSASTDDKVQIAKLKFCIKFGLGSLIPLVIILIVAVVYLFIAVHTLKNINYPNGHTFQKQRDEKEERMCILCSKLEFSLPSENIILDKLIKKIEGGKQICCAETAEQTDIFMKRYFDVKIKEERATGGLCMATSSGLSGRDFRNRRASLPSQDGARCTSSKNPSVHLIGSAELGNSNVIDHAPSRITHWADNSDVAFRNSMNFDSTKGILTVPTSGFYYVYSQIHFIKIYPRSSQVPQSQQETNDRMPNSNSLTHTIKRTHQHFYPEELLKRRQSQCWVTNKLYSEYTSYIGGIMMFRRGDEVFVEVSNKSMVSNQAKMNFFGMFFVAPNERN